MRLYPSARCDVRLADDIKAYEQYRATAERYDQERQILRGGISNSLAFRVRETVSFCSDKTSSRLLIFVLNWRKRRSKHDFHGFWLHVKCLDMGVERRKLPPTPWSRSRSL